MRTLHPFLLLVFLVCACGLNAQNDANPSFEIPIKEVHQERASQHLPRTAQKNMFTLDSVIYIKSGNSPNSSYSKSFYTYNSQGWLMSSAENQWNSNLSAYDTIEKVVYVRDQAGRITTREQFRGAFANLSPMLKTSHLYTNQGWLSELTVSIWNSVPSVYELKERWQYTYDSDGYETSEITQYYSIMDGIWVNSEKFETTYNANHEIIKYVSSSWNVNQASWVVSLREDYQFDGNNKVIEYTRSYDGAGIFDPIEKFTFQYNSQGLIIEENYLSINPFLGVFDVRTQRISTYNSTGKNDSLKVYGRDASYQLTLTFMEVYEYDPNGYISEVISTEYNSSIGDTLVSKRTMVNDQNGNVLQNVSFNWSSIQMQWDTTTILFSSYDGNDFKTLEEWYVFVPNGIRRGTVKKEWNRTVYGDAEVYKEYTWNDVTNQWFLERKQEWDFTESIPKIDLIDPIDLDFKSRYDSQKQWFFDANSNNLTLQNQLDYYWSPTSLVSVKDEAINSIQLYPNPTQGQLFIDGLGKGSAQLQLFDLNGKQVFTTTVNTNAALTLPDLTTGVYIYKIIQNSIVVQGKLVLE